MEEQGGYAISAGELFFFNEKPAALPLYETFAKRLLSEVDGVSVKPRKRTYTKAVLLERACVRLRRRAVSIKSVLHRLHKLYIVIHMTIDIFH